MENLHSSDKIYGLVLTGGRSTRMGRDKGSIRYHVLPQREHVYKLLQGICDAVFMSLRTDQLSDLPQMYKAIIDQDVYQGPFNGMLSAAEEYPEVAWLVLACDLPFINENVLLSLIENRDRAAMATTLALKNDPPLPEPMCAIWEANGLHEAKKYLQNKENGTCARKFLIRKGAHLVFPEEQRVLINVNTQDEYRHALAKTRR